MSLQRLPREVLLRILELLPTRDAEELSKCCRNLFRIAEQLVWRRQVLNIAGTASTLGTSVLPRKASWLARARLLDAIDAAWTEPRFACSCEARWPRCLPRLLLDDYSLLAVCGTELVERAHRDYPPSWRHTSFHRRTNDVCDAVRSGRDVFASLVNGDMVRLRRGADGRWRLRGSFASALPSQPAAMCHAMKEGPSGICVVERAGRLNVWTRGEWVTESLSSRPWTVAALGGASLGVGVSDEAGLLTYALAPDRIMPTRRLSGARKSRTAVYAIEASPDPRVVWSGWYDGAANAHDLRSCSDTPCISLLDPWDDDSACYAIALAGWHVVGGGARHSIVRVWDMRMTRSAMENDYSCYLGNESSPVYSLATDCSRVWAATESHAWQLDFVNTERDGAQADSVYMYRHTGDKSRVQTLLDTHGRQLKYD